MSTFISNSLILKIRSTFFYFGATVISFILSIGTYPLFAKYLNVSEFAAFNYFNNYSGFFTFLFSINLYMFFSAHFFKPENEQSDTLLKSLMSLLLVWNVFALGLSYFLSEVLFNSLLKIKFDTSQYLFLSLSAVSIATLKGIFLIKLRLKKQALQYFIVTVIARVFATLFSLLLIIYVDATAESRFLGVLLAEIVTALIIYISVFKNGGFCIPIKDFRRIIKFIWPLLLSSIVYYPLIGMDQMILERYVNKEQLGLYSIGLGFAGYLHTFNFSVYQTLEPDIIRASIDSDLKLLWKNVRIVIIIAFVSTVAFCFSSKLLISSLSGNKFTDAYYFANILSFSFFFVLIFTIGDTLLTVNNFGKKVLFNNLLGLLSICTLCYFLSPYDATGISWARTISYILLASITLFSIRKLLFMDGRNDFKDVVKGIEMVKIDR